MTGKLKERVIIVTGASRGIGAAAVRQLVQAGANVVLTARSAQTARAAGEETGAALALACDVTDNAAVTDAISQVEKRFGRIDAIVNNAGTIEPIGSIIDTDPQAWADAIRTNLVGVYHCVRAVLPAMLRTGGGTIVNLSTGAAFRPLEGWSAYCSSKAGLAMFTRAIAHEYGEQGISAIGLSPGLVDTGMQSSVRSAGINPVSQIPQEDLTPPQEPAMAIAWLCGPDGASYAGSEVDIRDPEFRKAAGLQPL